jgi:H+-transporting ATPase
MKNFITYRIAATMQLLVFFFIAVFALRPRHFQPSGDDWPPFFHMPVLMLMLITLLNDGTLIAIGYDNAVPSQIPEKWNLKALFLVSGVLAFVALGSSLLLLWAALDSNNAGSVFRAWGIPGLTYGQITTTVYLKVSISDFLTLFSARTSGDWFWTSKPSPILLCAASVALSASTAIACSWPDSKPDGIPALGLGRRMPKEMALWIWIYCLIWWIAQDAAKVVAQYYIVKFNVFGVADNLKYLEAAKSSAQKNRDLETESAEVQVMVHH